MSFLNELNETIKSLEDRIPANPSSRKNERLEKRLQGTLAEYFQNLDNALDWDAVEQIYYRYVK